ncbi:replicative DNA helicase [Fastidiosibacter lacustris]|uniref:replicative DNA helicase n=1 Tax=Fastidiosibacter lacustris TaxID=2056695 RepID=UPI000E352851|nr:replicative DNA helicase [Fastidiosibacter lacustris]
MYPDEAISLTHQLENIKRPPSSIDAERSVIGGLILDNEAWTKVEEILISDDFYSTQHRIIFHQMQKLIQQGVPFDIITLSDALSNEKLLEQAGGLHYLAEVTKNTPTAANIVAYAEIVKERAKLRVLLNTATDIANMVYTPQGRKVGEILDVAEQKILAIAETDIQKGDGPRAIREIIPSVIDRIDAMMEASDGITGISTGFTDLDELTSGLHSANLVIVAGRPSMGKTTFAMNLAENVARGAEKPVLVFSLEMPAEDIVLRMISSLGRVEQNALRNGRLEDEHWAKITTAMEVLSKDFNMHIDDSAGLSPSEMRSRARRVYKEHNGLSMIVVDYLQLMKVPGYENNRTQEVSEISRALKSLAKELHVPVVALSQLNRGVDDRADKRPMMSDLRDSGAIEQDADVIMFVYRDEVYHKDKEDNKGLGEIIIGKQRNGPIGSIKVHFEGRFCRFADLTFEQAVPIGIY